MSEMHFTRTPIERIIRRLVAQIGAVVLLICAVVILVEHSHGVLWPLAVIAGVSLAMAALPEELPMVYTLYLALGAWRLAKDKALVRRLASVETLGSTSVICVDKTGTLTEGRVEVAGVVAAPGRSEQDVVRAAALASEAAAFDPLDAAVLRNAARFAADGAVRVLANEYPFDAAKRFAAKVWRVDDTYRLALKGAVEVVLALCPLQEQERARILAQNHELASTGMRVIAVATAALPHADAGAALTERSLEFLGLLAFGDPIRAGVPQALAECRAAGIRVIMITGDHPATAQYVARAMGLNQETITGEQLDSMSGAELEDRIGRTDIFARTRAEQKLQIVRALHARGLVVAMTGDGTNDALALRESDIGIAMGQNGTEVARAAADLVLLDDDFTTIVRAVRDGRRIFDNLGHAFRYLNAFHMPLLIPAFLIPFLGVPLLLLPVHLVLLELIVHPTSALVFENDPPDSELMRHPPRPKNAGLLQKRDWIRPVVTGTLLSAAVLWLYITDLRAGDSVELARATAIFAMIVGQTVLVLTERASAKPVWSVPLRDNRSIAPILLGTLAALLAITYVPALDAALRLAPLSVHSVITAAAVALAATLLPELTKLHAGSKHEAVSLP
jgi:Ca2+-transporting ATPase